MSKDGEKVTNRNYNNYPLSFLHTDTFIEKLR